MKDYYSEIDKTLKSYEECRPCHPHSMDWVSDRICWCWKFKHITEKQMEELADRAAEIFERR